MQDPCYGFATATELLWFANISALLTSNLFRALSATESGLGKKTGNSIVWFVLKADTSFGKKHRVSAKH